MKTLVVYYSRDGHTRLIAKEISDALGSDIYEIIASKSRVGFIGWLLACRDAILKKTTVIEAPSVDLASYEHVIIGTPVWAFTIPSAVRSWLIKYGKNLKNTIFFATMGGQGDRRAFSHMGELCINKPLLHATFIDKEINKGTHKQKLTIFIDELKEIIG